MTDRHQRQPSLQGRIILLALLSILLVVPVHGTLSFLEQKQLLLADMKQQADESLASLSKNTAPLMASYAIAEYQKLVSTEAALGQYIAILVDDYQMARILGQPRYVSGSILMPDTGLTPYDPADTVQQARLTAQPHLLFERTLESEGQSLGNISIYMPQTAVEEKLNEVLYDSLRSSLLLAITLVALLGLFVRYQIVSPLKGFLASLSKRDADGIPVNPLPGFKYREFSSLSETLNRMIGLIRASRTEIKQEGDRLLAVIEGTNVGTWEWNIQTGETVFNERWAEIVGYTLEELQPTTIDTWARLTHPDDQAESEKQLQRHFAGETDFYQCEARMKHKDGHWVWVLDRGKLSKTTPAGEPLMVYGTHQDITRQKETELRLSLAARVFEHVNDGVMITDTRGVIQNVNTAFSALTGFESSEVIGRNASILSSGRHGCDFYRVMWGSLLNQGNWDGEVWNRHKAGDTYPVHLKISAIKGQNGATESYVAILSDISDFKAQQQKLEHLARFDLLTGLPNRMTMYDRLNQAMMQAREYDALLAVLFLDLDGFKAINDSLGHEAGDQLLIHLSRRMHHAVRDTDTVARIGGDEFVILLPDLHDRDAGITIIERLLSATATPVRLNNTEVRVSASIGASFYDHYRVADAEDLLHEADQLMYEAKQKGKNRYQLPG